MLVTASLLSSRHELDISPLWIGISASTGAIIGDTIGYFIGRRIGKPLFAKLGRRFPKHFSPAHVAFAERVFLRWGVFAVFFGRFIALLRIFAGPLAGALKMPYYKFLAANIAGGIVWAGGTTAAVYFLGVVAETWLKRFSWIGLVAALVAGLTIGWLVKRKTNRHGRAVRRRGRGGAAGGLADRSVGGPAECSAAQEREDARADRRGVALPPGRRRDQRRLAPGCACWRTPPAPPAGWPG